MNVALEESLRLLRLAERDERAFSALLATTPPEDFPAAAFHAQQAVEKAIKAILCLHSIEFRRTHDLLELASRIEAAGIAPPLTTDLLLRLSPYAVEFRYDDQAIPLIGPDAAKYAVRDCLAWCAEQINNTR